MRPRLLAPAAAVLAGVVVLAAACGGEGGETLIVFAASSLRDALTTAAATYEAEHGVAVTVSLAGSQALAAQIVQGAPADVFIAADDESIAAVVDEGLARGDVVTVARNRLAVLLPDSTSGSPSLADLAGLDVVLADPAVPAGRYAAEALARAGVELDPISLEPSVARVAARVALGEADAGIGYVTDGATAGLRAIPLDEPLQPEIRLPAVVLAGGDGPRAAAFLDWLTTGPGAAHLADAGFRVP